MTMTPPDWYDDGHGALRWWDGTRWTEHVAAPDGAPGAAGNPPAGADLEARVDRGVATDIAAGSGQAVLSAVNGSSPGMAPAGGPDPASGMSPWTAPVGYPVTEPFAAAATAPTGSAFSVTAEANPKPRGWIIWVAVGAVLLAIVVAAAVLIPVLLTAAAPTTSAADRGSSGSAEPSPDAGEPSAADEESAVAAVKLLDHAWSTADCDEYFAATTEDYRTFSEMETCEAFYQQARGFMGSVEGFTQTIREVEAVGSAVAVSTTEAYEGYFDEDGEPTEELRPYADRVEYFVIDVDGEWRVDDWFVD